MDQSLARTAELQVAMLSLKFKVTMELRALLERLKNALSTKSAVKIGEVSLLCHQALEVVKVINRIVQADLSTIGLNRRPHPQQRELVKAFLQMHSGLFRALRLFADTAS